MTNNESTSGTVIDMTENTTHHLVVMLTATSALAIEVMTGMRANRGRNAMDVARHYGFDGRLKWKAIEFLESKITELDPTHSPLPSVQKVLDSKKS